MFMNPFRVPSLSLPHPATDHDENLLQKRTRVPSQVKDYFLFEFRVAAHVPHSSHDATAVPTSLERRGCPVTPWVIVKVVLPFASRLKCVSRERGGRYLG